MQTGTQKGFALNAASPGGTGPYNFSWYRWSDITKVSAPFSKTDSGVSTSSSTDLDQADIKLLSAEDLIQVLSDGFLLTNLFHLQRYRIVHVTMLPKRPGRD